MNANPDRLYDLLPVFHRARDQSQGEPLRALLRIIGEQLELVERDIDALYEGWFIETCSDWLVPYIGDLVGWEMVPEAGEPGADPEDGARTRALAPRAEVANTVRFRRRKGSLALLELLARDVAGWPARAHECFYNIARTGPARCGHISPAATPDLRHGGALEQIGGPFDTSFHFHDVRRPNSHRGPGAHLLNGVLLTVWRLHAYRLDPAPAYCLDEDSHCFTFSILGNDAPLFTRVRAVDDDSRIAGPLDVPARIRRRALAENPADYYGPEAGIEILIDDPDEGPPQAVAPERIVVADLNHWHYRPNGDQVALDPELGRIAFPIATAPESGVRVRWSYGFSAHLGGGPYPRCLPDDEGAKVYPVGRADGLMSLHEAFITWKKEKPENAVFEIRDNNSYNFQKPINLREGQQLQLRAASGMRPVLRLLDLNASGPDYLKIKGKQGSRFILDGLLVTGRGLRVRGALASLQIRHSTLVPGWSLLPNCDPCRPTEPSLVLMDDIACVSITKSILGTIRVNVDEVARDPVPVHLVDSILDATSAERRAVEAGSGRAAHVLLTLKRVTVIGQVQVDSVELITDSILYGLVWVGRRQTGCVRFSYVPPASRTPQRFHCQPDLVEAVITDGTAPSPDHDAAVRAEQLRVQPRFDSTRYGTPDYARLTLDCAEEIRRGAADESEMGGFHHLYQPQRAANLRARLDEYSPAGMEAGIVYAS